MNKKIIGGIMAVLVVGGGAFSAGVAYGKGGSAPAAVRGQFNNGQFGANGGTRGMRGAGGFTAGEIIARDATSITVKMQDGSTKIILVGASAQIMKTAAGTAADLVQGANVVVTGTANSDGSITAQSVQIRPAGSPPFGGQARNGQAGQ